MIPRALRRRLKHDHPAAEQALSVLPTLERERAQAIQIAAQHTRKLAHAMLDSQLDTIMPELLTAIDAGRSFAVLVVDPEHMPAVSSLFDPQGKVIGA